MKNIFCRGILSLVFTLVAATTSFAQNKPVKVGEPLPDNFWTTSFQVVNHPQTTFNFNSDKNKLILLDFWATWCSACLKKFPEMEELKKKFSDRINIIAVTDQNRATIEKFFASTNGQRYKDVFSVVDDKILTRMFPHTAVPFIVWIKDGKIINTTDGGQVNEKTIAAVLKNETSSLQTVIQIDRKRPLMLSENFELEKLSSIIGYSLFAKGRIRAIPFGSGFHRDGEIVYGRQFTNFSLMNIYRGISYELFREFGDKFSDKRLINLVKNPEVIDFNTTTGGNFEKLYSVEYIVPKEEAKNLYPRMLRYVNENSSYVASIEKKPVICLVLRRTSYIDKMTSKGGESIGDVLKPPYQLRNVTLDYLLSALEATNIITSLPVIDETGYQGKVDLKFSNFQDLKTIQKELSAYDLELVETDKELPMLVVKDKSY
ncbi:TlpA family protein disulfide reductase [Elizabethkingia meningoseptica]|uniref:TlpA family protein disulfide reductase n=1 Tax=Elizabethkingia meningoseptica TaxID=238 RepID=UPI0023B154DF|nr:TlpA disulfide reductase family protein [Elizabethkingia meningoseptica]MDE5538437.1 TlpA family protein disulfide reductase [Elizabethkingia meningoseptica]